MVTVYDPGFTSPTAMSPTQLTSQASTGACGGTSSYWDIGVRGDGGPGDHSGGTLSPYYSILTNTGSLDEGTAGTNNQYPGTVSPLASIYCNGSRVPPESGGSNWQVPPGTNESNALPAPPFNLTAGGTVDEGNNWINLTWGPLWDPLSGAMPGVTAFTFDATPQSPVTSNPVSRSNQYGAAAPPNDFFGNQRSQTAVAIGAVEAGGNVAPTFTATVSPASLTFTSQASSTTSAVQTITVTNTGNQTLTGGTFTFGGGSNQYARATSGAEGGNCTGTLVVGASCTYGVVFTPTATGTLNRTLTVAYAGATVTPASVSLLGTGTGTPNLYVTPAGLDFGSVPVGATGLPAQTVTVHNATGSTRTLTPTFSAGFQRANILQGGAGNCGTGATFTLNNNASCTINIVFHPTAAQAYNGTLTITSNGGFTVANSPVKLTGTGVTLALNPNAWTPTQQRNCPGSGLGIILCGFDPSQGFTLTNTGTSAITGVTVNALTGANTADFRIVPGFTTCGSGVTTLAANGGNCIVTVQFQPLTAESAGQKTVTLSITDSAGTQSVTIFATAN